MFGHGVDLPTGWVANSQLTSAIFAEERLSNVRLEPSHRKQAGELPVLDALGLRPAKASQKLVEKVAAS